MIIGVIISKGIIFNLKKYEIINLEPNILKKSLKKMMDCLKGQRRLSELVSKYFTMFTYNVYNMKLII